MPSTPSHLECSRPACSGVLDHTSQHLCPNCQAPLLARYDLDRARWTLTREALRARCASMWRYEEVLPGGEPVTLGEGMTPVLHARRLGQRLSRERLFIKDEGQNPTASFKARGLWAAVSVASALGAETIALPTAGNAGGAAAAYAAREGIFAAPQGGAGLAAIQTVVEQGRIGANESVVLFNTSSGHKYGEAWNRALAT